MDDQFSLHTYPRSTDPVSNSWLSVGNVTTNTFTVNVGTTLPVTYTPSGATYDPTTGLMELTIGNHTITANTSIKLAQGAITFKCDEDSQATQHAYPRATIDTHTATTGTTYNPTTGIMNITTTAAHGMRNGDWVKFDNDSISFSCAYGGTPSTKTYPRSSDFIAGKWQKVTVVDTTNFTIQVLETQPSTNTDAHTFVSAIANGIKQKRDRSYDTAVTVQSVTAVSYTHLTLPTNC